MRLAALTGFRPTLGFTLDDIEDLLQLSEGGPESCQEARTMAGTRIAELQLRINELAGDA